MKNRDKMLTDIIINVLEIIPPDKDILHVVLEDYDTQSVVEVDIKLKIREMEGKKNGKIKH